MPENPEGKKHSVIRLHRVRKNPMNAHLDGDISRRITNRCFGRLVV